MREYTLYDPATGAITGHFSGSHPPRPGKSIEGHYAADAFLVRNGKPVAVPVWTPKVSANRVSGIPRGATVRWGGEEHEEAVVDDGEVEFDLVGRQTRQLIITAPGRPPYYLEVTA